MEERAAEKPETGSEAEMEEDEEERSRLARALDEMLGEDEQLPQVISSASSP